MRAVADQPAQGEFELTGRKGMQVEFRQERAHFLRQPLNEREHPVIESLIELAHARRADTVPFSNVRSCDSPCPFR